MTDADRIKLAEAMGWVRKHPDSDFFFPPSGQKLSGQETYHILGLPRPDSDANDCNALIKHLNGLNYDVRIWHSGNSEHQCNVRCRVRLWHCSTYEKHEYAGDNWMQGICELALKAID